MSAQMAHSVLVVDDSAMMRRLVASIIERMSGFVMSGAAGTAEEGWDHLVQHDPESIILDMELPGRNGLALLERVMRQKPRRVVMISGRADRESEAVQMAHALGAVDFVEKPNGGQQTLDSFAAQLAALLAPHPSPACPIEKQIMRNRMPHGFPQVLAIGASTGGVEALMQVMRGMAHFPLPIVITQHIPAGFAARLATGFSLASGLEACEARDGQVLKQGLIIVAPGGRHLSIRRDGNALRCVLGDGIPVSGHRPSVDVLFQSVCVAAGGQALGVLLTGMGRDGAEGLLAMREAGAITLCQNEATCVVFGMPKAAIALDAADMVLPLHDIAPRLHELVNTSTRHLLRA
jgi:two-component system, chemotaxis family, protein-glutamate methylesterase/glutaminase